MNTKELRIGNYVNYFENSTIFEVIEIDVNGLTVVTLDKSEENWIEIENFEGISITEEWLLNFSFVQASEFKQHYLLECEFGIYEYAFFDASNSLWINETFIPNIKYVHQLQNLYFALTQTELEYEKSVQ